MRSTRRRSPDNRATTLDSLSGGGEMGAMIREKDWSATSLGPPERWPQSLRTALSIMLESRFPMVVAWGPEFRFFYNNGYRPILGVKHPDALGKPGSEIFPEVWDIVGPEFDRVRRGESFAIEDWLLPLDRNGYIEDCWFTLSYSPIRDETGGVGGLLAVVAETTDRVQGERRLATLRDLARSTDAKTPAQACERAAAIFDANTIDVPFALAYLLDPDGTTVRLQAAAQLNAGHAAAPSVVDLTDAAPAAWPLRRAIESREVIVVDDLERHFGALPGGPHPEPANTAVVLPLARAGVPQPYGVLVLGVSPRRALDERYRSFMELAAEHVVAGISSATAYQEERRKAEMLAELDRAKTMFFSNVSHEFRTPLTLMLGPLEDLLAGGRGTLPAVVREELSSAHRNALRLLKLVNSLLDFSRLEAGRAQAVYEATDLATLTVDLASVFRAAMERAGLRYVVSCPPLPEPVFVDRDMWEKIVLNLVSNAFKFTTHGEVAVELRPAGDFVELEVRDTGVGIPEAERPNIFKRFHRVQDDRARTHEGTGIGLALVHDLVALHGGDVRVESTPDKGSRFIARIRTGTSHLSPEHIGTRAHGERSTTIGAEAFVSEAMRWLPDQTGGNGTGDAAMPEPRARVLVVDDNADMRSYVARLLGGHYQVETATDGLDALRCIDARRPDLVLTDVMMPRLDGVELLKRIRANASTREIPVIMLSARAGEESRVEGLVEGADDYVVKPFTTRELLARVQTHIDLVRVRSLASRERERLSDLERRRFASIFESAPSLIAVLRGPRHVFEAANPVYHRIVGGRDLIGRTVREALPELEGQGYFELLDRVFQTGQPFVGRESKALLRRKPDAEPEEVFFDFVYQPLFDPDGQVTGVFVHGHDVTDQVRARHQIEELYERVRDANASKVQFLAAMSHELRTPLNAVLGYADLLSMDVHGPLSDPQRDDLARIRNAAHYLLGLINDILNFTRLEAGQLSLELRPVDVRGLLDRAREIMWKPIADKQLALEYARPEEPLSVLADGDRAQQILLNLLTNALKFTPPGGRICLACDADASTTRIRVRDSGCGIAPDHWTRIFEPFVQLNRHTENSGRHGVGLGLSISRDLARRMGGDVSVTSSLGEGAEFVLTLPRHHVSPGADLEA